MTHNVCTIMKLKYIANTNQKLSRIYVLRYTNVFSKFHKFQLYNVSFFIF